MCIVTEKFLLSIGFKKEGEVSLPDWYNIFEVEPHITSCESFSFCTSETALTIFVTPKGLVAESCSNDEFRDFREYHSIRGPEDVIDCIEGCLELTLKWERQE